MLKASSFAILVTTHNVSLICTFEERGSYKLTITSSVVLLTAILLAVYKLFPPRFKKKS